MTDERTGLVMIMMPAYNRDRYIEESVESVRSQTYTNWKLIVVDDGSTDQTLNIAKDLAKKDDRIEVIELNHSGEATARNTALSRADSNTEFVAFLDSDDVWDNNVLHTLIDSLRLHEDCVGAHGKARIVDSDGKLRSSDQERTWGDVRKGVEGLFPKKIPPDKPTDFSMLVYGNFVPIGATLVRRWVYDKIGEYNRNTFIYLDWEMWIRISSLGPFAFIDKELYNYRIHASNAPKPEKFIFDQEKQFFSSIYNEGNLTDKQRTTLARGYRMHQLHHGLNYMRYFGKKLMKGKLSSSAKELRKAMGRVSCAFTIKPFDSGGTP